MADRPPVEQVLADLYPWVTGYVGKRVPHDMVDDVVQDTMVSLYRSWPRLEYDPARIRGLAARVAGRRITDAWRVWARTAMPVGEQVGDDLAPVDVPDPAPGPEQVVLDAVEVGEWLGLLPERDRTVLTLRVLLGVPAEEVGQLIGLSAPAVRVAQSRALDRAAAQTDPDQPSRRSQRSRFRQGGVAPPPP